MASERIPRFLFNSPSLLNEENAPPTNSEKDPMDYSECAYYPDRVDDDYIETISRYLEKLDCGNYEVLVDQGSSRTRVSIDSDVLQSFFLPNFKDVFDLIRGFLLKVGPVEDGTNELKSRLDCLLDQLNLEKYKKISVILLIQLVRTYPKAMILLFLSLGPERMKLQRLIAIALGYASSRILSILGAFFWDRLVNSILSASFEGLWELMDILDNPNILGPVLSYLTSHTQNSTFEPTDTSPNFVQMKKMLIEAQNFFDNTEKIHKITNRILHLLSEQILDISALICDLVVFLEDLMGEVPQWRSGIEKMVDAIFSYTYREILTHISVDHEGLNHLVNVLIKSSIVRKSRYRQVFEWKSLMLAIGPRKTVEESDDRTVQLKILNTAFPTLHLTWSQVEMAIRSGVDQWDSHEIIIFLKNIFINLNRRDGMTVGRRESDRFCIMWLMNLLSGNKCETVTCLTSEIIRHCIRRADWFELCDVSINLIKIYEGMLEGDESLESRLICIRSLILEVSDTERRLIPAIVDQISAIIYESDWTAKFNQVGRQQSAGMRGSNLDEYPAFSFDRTSTSAGFCKKKNIRIYDVLLLLEELMSLDSTGESVERFTDLFLSSVDVQEEVHTVEQYMEFLPKKSNFDRDTALECTFLRRPVLFDVLELVAANPRQLCRCISIIRSLLVMAIGNLSYSQCGSADSVWRSYTSSLMRILEKVNWMPYQLFGLEEVLSRISSKDIGLVLLSIWCWLADEDGFSDPEWRPSPSNEAAIIATVRFILRKNLKLLKELKSFHVKIFGTN